MEPWLLGSIPVIHSLKNLNEAKMWDFSVVVEQVVKCVALKKGLHESSPFVEHWPNNYY